MTDDQQAEVERFLATDAAKAKVSKVVTAGHIPALFHKRITGELYIADLEGALPDGRTICVLDEDGAIDSELSEELLMFDR